MSVSQLSVVALRGLISGACKAVGLEIGEHAVDGVFGFFKTRLSDPSQKQKLALKRSIDRSWRALEIALAGESLLNRLDRAEDRAFREQIRTFLEAFAEEYPEEEHEFHRRALADLRKARKKGVLAERDAGDEECRAVVEYIRYADPTLALQAEWSHLTRLGGDLRSAGYEDLGQLVQIRASDGSCLIAVAVRFFFRQELTTDPQLFQGVMVDRVDALGQRLEQGFQGLTAVLQQQGERLESLLESVQAVVVETHAAVLDLQSELQRQGDATRHQVDAMYQAVQALQNRLDLGQRELRPRDSLSIRNETERQAVKEIIAQYRGMPAERRRELPALLNAIGKLEVAAGSFTEARRDFDTVAQLVGNDPARGEAHYNGYLAALESEQFDQALAELRQAVACDAERFAPFPLTKYQPLRILGAGGFGVTFQCRY